MKNSDRAWSALRPAAFAALTVLLVLPFLHGLGEFVLQADEEDEGPLIRSPGSILMQDGEMVIRLDRTTQSRSGIRVSPLVEATQEAAAKAYGTILNLQGLLDQVHAVAEADAEVKKADASLNASRKEYDRLKSLYRENRDVSEKALQEAEAAFSSDRARFQAAASFLKALKESVLLDWGEVITEWLFNDSSDFEDLVTGKSLLIQVTLSPLERLAEPPAEAVLRGANNARVQARIVSTCPRTEPRLQGETFFYKAPGGSGLLPGMNVVAELPTGKKLSGVIVPPGGLVWWEGKAWVFIEKTPEHFVRREVSTHMPVEGGWFVSKGLAAGDRIVVEGAQLLLSELLRSEIQIQD